jgi:zinc-finger-containing domain
VSTVVVTPGLVCPDCNWPAELLTDSSSIYHGRDYGPVWVCGAGCDTRVGCHPGTTNPKGTLAGPPLRQARQDVHAAFDPLWKGRGTRVRARTYAWLAHAMAIAPAECHVSMFDLARCNEAIRVIQYMKPTAQSVREWGKEREL